MRAPTDLLLVLYRRVTSVSFTVKCVQVAFVLKRIIEFLFYFFTLSSECLEISISLSLVSIDLFSQKGSLNSLKLHHFKE